MAQNKSTNGINCSLPIEVLNRLASDSNAALEARGELTPETEAPMQSPVTPIMTIKQTVAAINELPGMRARYRSLYKEFQVGIVGRTDADYFTPDKVDALSTARCMKAAQDFGMVEVGR